MQEFNKFLNSFDKIDIQSKINDFRKEVGPDNIICVNDGQRILSLEKSEAYYWVNIKYNAEKEIE